MQRRELLKQSALAIAAFSFSRDLFSREAEKKIINSGFTDFIKLSSNENPHGPSPMARKAMMQAVNGSNRYPWEVTTQLREKIGAMYNGAVKPRESNNEAADIQSSNNTCGKPCTT